MKRYMISDKVPPKISLQKHLPSGSSSKTLNLQVSATKRIDCGADEIYQSIKHVKSQRKGRRAHTRNSQRLELVRFMKKTLSAGPRLVKKKHKSVDHNLWELFDNINRNTKTFCDTE